MAKYYEDLPETPEGAEPPVGNLASAAVFLAGIFGRNNINCAFLGGFACLMLGSSRRTGDIDVCVQSSFRQIRQALEAEERVHLPLSRLVSGVLRIFIETGPPWDNCAEDVLVQADLKEAGEGAGPRRLDASTSITVRWSSPETTAATIPLLNPSYLLRAKLSAWNRRGDQKFDRDDVLWLLERYGNVVDPSVLDEGIAADFASSCESEEERDWVLRQMGLASTDTE